MLLGFFLGGCDREDELLSDLQFFRLGDAVELLNLGGGRVVRARYLIERFAFDNDMNVRRFRRHGRRGKLGLLDRLRCRCRADDRSRGIRARVQARLNFRDLHGEIVDLFRLLLDELPERFQLGLHRVLRANRWDEGDGKSKCSDDAE